MADGDLAQTMVLLTDPVTDDRIDSLDKKVGKLAVSRRFQLVNGFAATLSKGQIKRLSKFDEVVHIEEDSEVEIFNDGAQAAFGVAAARQHSGLSGSADGNVNSFSRDDLVVAVIDTGIDATHLDLDEGKVIAFKDWVNGRTTPYDDNWHGTHVAATIAGDGDARGDRLYQGVAPGAALIGLKVLNASGSGSLSNVAAAIDWVVANRALYGIEAISLSLGSIGCSNGTDTASLALNRAADAGVVPVVAAGNSGPGACSIGSPGAAAKAITVGAMADTASYGFKQADWSSRGPTADNRIKPDISAPGVSITSAHANTSSGYLTKSGTSMATPFVAGVTLLMRQLNPALSAQQVKDLIMQTAIDWGRGGNSMTPGSRGTDAEYGAGRLDAYAAIRAAGAAMATPPPVPAHWIREGTLSGTGARADYPIAVTDTRFPIAGTLLTPGIVSASATTPDFDLYLYDAAGTLVAGVDTNKRQDDFGFYPPAAGNYTLRVLSNSGAGNYVLDVSAGGTLGGAPPPPPPPAGGYSSTVLADSPAGYWRFGETSGTTAYDSSGRGGHAWYWHGVSLGALGAVIGDPNAAASFDGIDDHVSIGDFAQLNPASQLTLEAWVRPASIAGFSQQKPVIVKGFYSHTPPFYEYALFMFDTWTMPRHVSFAVALNGVWTYLAANVGWQYGVWNHLAATYNGSRMRIYLNGNEVASKAAAGGISRYSKAITVGAYDNLPKVPYYSFEGRIDEVAIYGRALAGDEVRSHYDAGS